VIGENTWRNTSSSLDRRTVRWAQFALVLVVAAAFGLAYLLSEAFRSEVNRAANVLGRGDLEGLRNYILSFGAWAPVASLLLMVFQALVAPIPAFLVAFANGLAFGVFWGWVLSLAGHSLAAAVCFWLARVLGRGSVEALVGRVGLESADHWFARWGAHAVFVTRLVPGMAFDVVSYAAGLTRMGFGRFIAATAIGVAPKTFLEAYLGRQAPQYAWVLLALTGLVIGGLVVATILKRKRHAGPVRGEELAPRAGAQAGDDPFTLISSPQIPPSGDVSPPPRHPVQRASTACLVDDRERGEDR
jgi:uncharacterized membrane protein YdjX (TVP38/TMEM64 family)